MWCFATADVRCSFPLRRGDGGQALTERGLDLLGKAGHGSGVYYEQNIDGCRADAIGEHGLTDAELAPLLDAANGAIAELREAKVEGAADILALPARRDDIAVFGPIAEAMRSRFETVVVFGMGGSSLGGRAIAALRPGGASAVDDKGAKLRFMDNLDPATMTMLIETTDFAHTGFLVISKSGTTAETMAQYLVSFAAARDALGDDASSHFVVITDPTDNPLRRLAVDRGHTILDHDPGVGGRFSVLSAVGMLPAAIAGLDPASIRTGAASVLERTLDTTSSNPNPAAIGAAIAMGLARHRGTNMSVLMPYGDALDPFAAWYCQLWAESLGKDGQGTTPVRALGPVDQHSQLQLYLDGPRDKMFTIIEAAVQGTGLIIPVDDAENKANAYLTGASVGDLVAAQQKATAETLIRHGRPTRVIHIAQVGEGAMGALFMHFMLETIVAARMLGVAPFNQPVVDEGKMLARSFLSQR